jgi:hypothetical protein
MPKNAEKFLCQLCHFKCSKQSNYEKHLLTSKHKNRTILNDLEQKNAKKCQDCSYLCTKCNKTYRCRNSLWYHKQKCVNEDSDNLENQLVPAGMTDKELILMLAKQNSEFLEIMKNGLYNNNSHNINNNSHNKTFNLNFFLNETCKDAMNLTDFIDSIKLQLSDLESVGELGYVEGISNIIVKSLKALDVTKRPVHCSDSKREVIYIKDEDKWEKEGEEKNKLKQAIKRVAHKNITLIPEFRKKYPDCGTSTSKRSDQYNKIIIESMGGSGNNDSEKEEKIIRKIAKEMAIDKSAY